jgi:hypothetical protein
MMRAWNLLINTFAKIFQYDSVLEAIDDLSDLP